VSAGRAGCALGGIALVAAGLMGMTGASGPPGGPASEVIARVGAVTVRASALRPGQPGTLTTSVRVTLSGRGQDQLDAAIAADGAPAGLYHTVISLLDLPDDLASCGGAVPPSGVVSQWMHSGPLVVYGTSPGSSVPAVATLTIPRDGASRAGQTEPITLYFAHAGPVVLRLTVSGG